MTNPTSRYFDTRSTFTANPRCYVAREWESDESFAKLAFDYHAQFEPVGPVEIYLVDALVLSDHEKRRVSLMQTQVLENRIAADDGHPSAFGLIYIEDQNGPKLLPKLARQLARLERTANADARDNASASPTSAPPKRLEVVPPRALALAH